jgi:hypothetical protein
MTMMRLSDLKLLELGCGLYCVDTCVCDAVVCSIIPVRCQASAQCRAGDSTLKAK